MPTPESTPEPNPNAYVTIKVRAAVKANIDRLAQRIQARGWAQFGEERSLPLTVNNIVAIAVERMSTISEVDLRALGAATTHVAHGDPLLRRLPEGASHAKRVPAAVRTLRAGAKRRKP